MVWRGVAVRRGRNRGGIFGERLGVSLEDGERMVGGGGGAHEAWKVWSFRV